MIFLANHSKTARHLYTAQGYQDIWNAHQPSEQAHVDASVVITVRHLEVTST